MTKTRNPIRPLLEEVPTVPHYHPFLYSATLYGGEDDETTRKLKRKAEEIGIGFIDVKTVEDEVELLQLCALPVNLPTKTKLRRLIRAAQQPPVFRVSARVKGALRSHGAGGMRTKDWKNTMGFTLMRRALR